MKCSRKSVAWVAVLAVLAVTWQAADSVANAADSYIRYDKGADRADPGYPKNITCCWPGIWARGIDAAVNWGNGKAYFFSGNQYIRYDIAQDRADPGYPKQIDDGTWPGLWPGGVDAAINWGNGKAYFFKGNQYIRYDIAQDRADAGYPKSVDDKSWPGLAALGPIESAINWNNGKAYFFGQSGYVRYDVSADRADPGYPNQINDQTWPGLSFQGIDAALSGEGGKAYFFERSARQCPDPNSPGVSYTSQDLSVCQVIMFHCEAGQTLFSDDCGCGCLEDRKVSEAPQPPASPGTGGNLGPGKNAPDNLVLTPTVINAGQWADGITVFDGQWLWVAESGQRTIARINLDTGKVIERVKVGRLPTYMETLGEGTVFALVATDQIVWRQDARGRRKKLVWLPECPEAMTGYWPYIWVLTLPDCSSDKSRVYRIDSRSGEQAKSAVLGEWATALTPYGDEIWVAHTRIPSLTIVDQKSLNATTVTIPSADFWAISANSDNVYAAGRVDGTKSDGLIIKFDPATRQELNRASVPEMVMKMVADDAHVVVGGEKGTIWVFSAKDLRLQRTITLSTGAFRPAAVIFQDERLLVSSGTHSGENGAVFVLRNWRP